VILCLQLAQILSYLYYNNEKKDRRMYSLNNENQDKNLNAETIMETCMDLLYDICISPMEDELDEKNAEAIGMIGITLKQIAQKAQCYENMTGFNGQEKNPFERN